LALRWTQITVVRKRGPSNAKVQAGDGVILEYLLEVDEREVSEGLDEDSDEELRDTQDDDNDEGEEEDGQSEEEEEEPESEEGEEEQESDEDAWERKCLLSLVNRLNRLLVAWLSKKYHSSALLINHTGGALVRDCSY